MFVIFSSLAFLNKFPVGEIFAEIAQCHRQCSQSFCHRSVSSSTILLHAIQPISQCAVNAATRLHPAWHTHSPSGLWQNCWPAMQWLHVSHAPHEVNCLAALKLRSRRTHYLEQSAGQCDLCSVCVDLPSASGNIIWRYFRSPLNYPPAFVGSLSC